MSAPCGMRGNSHTLAGATLRRSVSVTFRRRLIQTLWRAQGGPMTQCPRLIPALLTIAAFASAGLAPTSPAWAADPDAAPAAAPPAAAPAPLTIGEQIDNYIRTS